MFSTYSVNKVFNGLILPLAKKKKEKAIQNKSFIGTIPKKYSLNRVHVHMYVSIQYVVIF